MLRETVKLEVSSNPKLCSLVRKFVDHICEKTGFCPDDIPPIVLAVDEAFSNVIRHAYKMDFEQRIAVEMSFVEKSHLEILLIDDGPPANPACLKGRSLEDVRPGGLGIHFMCTIMDEIEQIPRPGGNILRMVKYIDKLKPCTNVTKRRDPELLKTLLEIGQSLHRILDLETLLDLIVKKVGELMHSEGASVLLLDESKRELVFHTVMDEDIELVKRLKGLRFPANKGIAGRVMQTGKPALVEDVTQDPDHFRDVDRNTGSATYSLLYAPLKVRDRIIGILGVKNKKQGKFDRADQDVLISIAGTVALSIDNARIHNKLKVTRRLKKELNAARLMHEATLPQGIPEIPGLTLSAICEPATEVGGDYYDIFPLKSGKYSLAIGDVSGHGLEAGMMVSMAHSCLYTQLRFSQHIGDVMSAMNQMVYGSVKRRLIMTFFFGVYDSLSHVFRFANAGHPPFYYYSSLKRSWGLVDDGDFPLGVLAKYRFSIFTRRFHPGDMIVWYSDGIIEAADPQGNRYGMERLEKLLASRSWVTTEQIQARILEDVDLFCQDVPHSDDRTLVIARVK